MKALDRCINKLREVALDLTEPQDGAQLEHQAAKINGVADGLEIINKAFEKFTSDFEQLLKDASTNVHGGGTGNE